MQVKNLEIFNEMPFFFWVKDEEGTYLWVNRALSEMAKHRVIGKTDYELPWADNADALRTDDNQGLEMGKPLFFHEYVKKPHDANLSVCKFVGEFNGKICTFGVSFVVK
jgi:PAS domain-containing protein